MEILGILINGSKGIREIRRTIGGSNTTIRERIKDLLALGLVKDHRLTGEEFGTIPREKRLISLTLEGRTLTQSLVDLGLLKTLRLPKDREKWIVLLLNFLNVVKGRTRLTKLLFLLKHEMGCNRSSPYRFKPGRFGPFSKGIIEDLQELRQEGLIEMESLMYTGYGYREEEILYIYRLSPLGKDLTSDLLDRTPPGTEKKIEALERFNKMPLIKLLQYVYERHPRFITNSVIVRHVLEESLHNI